MRIRRKTKRFLRRAAVAVPVILAAGFLYLLLRSPSSANPANLKVEMTPANIERGRYLFVNLCDCGGCHSPRDFTRLGAPVVEAERGQGAVMPLAGLPGRIVASNITPDPETGIGAWSDGEKIRAIREGVSRDGRALYPLMPYQRYRLMSDEDAQALVAFLNSLKPIRNPLPKTQVSFPTSMWIKSVPQPVTNPVPPMDEDGGEIYGEYLTALANCEECHTPQVKGNAVPALRFAGGRLFETPYGQVASANITPDAETGIGTWDFKRFQEAMQAYRQYAQGGAPPARPEQFTLMPWAAYAGLTGHDLESLFIAMRARPPVSHQVQIHPGLPEPRGY
jgi:mono/diheme cytochrome c family protein